MNDERLQEIKELNKTRKGNLWSSSTIDELITALEEAQAEVERLRKVEEMYDSHKPFLRVHGFSVKEIDK